MRSDTAGGGGVADLDELERFTEMHVRTGNGNPLMMPVSSVRQLIAAARREQEAREIIASLVEADQYVFCCGSWPHDGRRPHAPTCAWGKARAWLAAKGAETDHASQ